ncbi:MAG: DUF2244 domain-containing protein [Paracoccaceae bacterium]
MSDPTATTNEPAGASASAGFFMDWAERDDPPTYTAELWPNRSLTPLGRRRFLWLVAAGFALPLLPIVATPVVWIPLLFAALVLGALWYALRRNTADARLVERVAIWPDEMRVERVEPSGRIYRWSAEPTFVRLTLHEDARPEHYLTIKGGGREIELGAFLAPEERQRLAGEIEGAIRRALTGRDAR